jgi:hypothetical protein
MIAKQTCSYPVDAALYGAAHEDLLFDNNAEGCDDDVARTKNCHESICALLR